MAQMRILIVEDEAVIGMWMALELRDAGHEVPDPIGNASDAERAALRILPELILLDVDLAGPGNGLTLARFLQTRSDARVLFVTGRPDTARAHRNLGIGLLSKPFSSEDLRRAVEIAQSIRTGHLPPALRIPPHLRLF
jgi:two-component system, response regulator PdtaR